MPVVAWRLAEMLGAVTAEVRERCKIHKFCYLGEGQAFIIQILCPVTRLMVAERYLGDTFSRSA